MTRQSIANLAGPETVVYLAARSRGSRPGLFDPLPHAVEQSIRLGIHTLIDDTARGSEAVDPAHTRHLCARIDRNTHLNVEIAVRPSISMEEEERAFVDPRAACIRLRALEQFRHRRSKIGYRRSPANRRDRGNRADSHGGRTMIRGILESP